MTDKNEVPDGEKPHGAASDDAIYRISDNKKPVKTTQDPIKGPQDAIAGSDITRNNRIRPMINNASLWGEVREWLVCELRHLPSTVVFIGACYLFYPQLTGQDLGPALLFWGTLGIAVLVGLPVILTVLAYRWTVYIAFAAGILWLIHLFN